jgi:hypothetical protein
MTHYYEKNIVEIRNEYTTFLTNILSPLIYEGLLSIYTNSINLYNDMNVEQEADINPQLKKEHITKIFQLSLKEIPALNNESIETETTRIKDKAKCSDFFDNLVKSVIKSNIILLTFNATGKQCELVNAKYHEKADVKAFIHKCYIECAKLFFYTPELFVADIDVNEEKSDAAIYHKREIYELIKLSICEAVRKMLPVKEILEEYLKNDYIAEEEPADEIYDPLNVLNNDPNAIAGENENPETNDKFNHIRSLIQDEIKNELQNTNNIEKKNYLQNKILLDSEDNDVNGFQDDVEDDINSDDMDLLKDKLRLAEKSLHEMDQSESIPKPKQPSNGQTASDIEIMEGYKNGSYLQELPVIKKSAKKMFDDIVEQSNKHRDLLDSSKKTKSSESNTDTNTNTATISSASANSTASSASDNSNNNSDSSHESSQTKKSKHFDKYKSK